MLSEKIGGSAGVVELDVGAGVLEYWSPDLVL